MMKRLELAFRVIMAVALLSALSVEAVAQQPVGTAENDANVDTGNVYVGIKNPKPAEQYCVVKNGAIVATLSVVVTVGDFGAVMRIEPKGAAAGIKKGDSIYLKRDIPQALQAPPAPVVTLPPSPAPLPPLSVLATSTPLPLTPFQPARPDAPFLTPAPPDQAMVTPLAPVAVVPALPPLDVGASAKPAPHEEPGTIIIDNDDPGATLQEPVLSWVHSMDPSAAYGNSALITILASPTVVKITYLATIPQEGSYEIYLWWLAASERYRSKRVPVTVYTLDGDVKVTIDQTKGSGQFNSIGRFNLKAGERQPIVTISNEGINKTDRGYVSADAVKLVARGAVQK